MIITLTGKNDFLLKRRLTALTDEFLRQEDALALERIDASTAQLNNVLDAVQSVPFLANRKMVIIRTPGENKQLSENIEQIVDSTAETTDLIIIDPALDKRTAYFKTLKTKTQLEELAELDGGALAKWLVAEAKEQEGELSLGDANYLVDRIGPHQLLLFGELEKLLTYNPHISRESIDLLTEKTPQSKVFDLLDATFAGNKAKALALYEEQRAQRVEPQAIMALMAWQLQIIALAKYGKGKTAAQIAKDAKLSPYPVQKAQALAAKLSLEKLKQMINDAADIDYKSKTTSINLDEALKAYIVSL